MLLFGSSRKHISRCPLLRPTKASPESVQQCKTVTAAIYSKTDTSDCHTVCDSSVKFAANLPFWLTSTDGSQTLAWMTRISMIRELSLVNAMAVIESSLTETRCSSWKVSNSMIRILPSLSQPASILPSNEAVMFSINISVWAKALCARTSNRKTTSSQYETADNGNSAFGFSDTALM